MKIAVYQSGPNAIIDKPTRIASLARRAREARDAGAELIAAPEMYLTGYNIGREKILAESEPLSGESLSAVCDIARETGIAIVVGFGELGDDGRNYNACALFDKTGKRRLLHRKIQLFGELDRSCFAPGNNMPLVIDWNGIKVSMLICYDVEFPELVRSIALKGCDLLLVPTAQMAPYDRVAEMMVPVRAMESQMFLAYANRCDQEGALDYVGKSVICSPWRDLARADGQDGLIMADLDFDALKKSRAEFPYLADRRPESYFGILDEN
ncbi:carbon-nitrogen hydrolase family protein [Thalassospira sp.]|uniref:carbon-nitrogen hydrolase family protein n=1 Tax=Thalassospira sp. TaxID=1912094 RepID=UPI0032F056F4